MCDCVKKINEELRAKYGIGGVEFTFGGDKITLSAWYKTRTKKGDWAKHARYLSLNDKIKYCPFCGKPYKEDENHE